MEFERKHKTEQIGASYDTDYKVITRCIPDCPACAQKELFKYQAKQLKFNVSAISYLDITQSPMWQSLLKHFELEVNDGL